MAAATVAPSSVPSLAPPDAEPFERHVLALLTQFLQQPSPSFPFPTGDLSGDGNPVVNDLPRYDGKRTKTQTAIESAIIALGERASEASRRPSPATVVPAQASLMTPDWTPPLTDSSFSSAGVASATSTDVSRPPLFSDDSTTPTSYSSTHSSSYAPYAHPGRSMSVSSYSGQQKPYAPSLNAAGWGKSPSQAGSMTAEKELALLRAQVQDIARVCKVRCKKRDYRDQHLADFPGRRDRRLDAKDHRTS